jgi:hypothetical protein
MTRARCLGRSRPASRRGSAGSSTARVRRADAVDEASLDTDASWLVVSFIGTDVTRSQTVHARHLDPHGGVERGRRSTSLAPPRMAPRVGYQHFHDTAPIEEERRGARDRES